MSKWDYDRPILPHENEVSKRRQQEDLEAMLKVIGSPNEGELPDKLEDLRCPICGIVVCDHKAAAKSLLEENSLLRRRIKELEDAGRK